MKKIIALLLYVCASLAQASSVVITPGSAAGYLYIPASSSNTSSGASGGGTYAATPSCDNLSAVSALTIGSLCVTPEGALVKYAGIYGGSHILVTDYSDEGNGILQDPFFDTALPNYSSDPTTDFAGKTNTPYWQSGTGYARTLCDNKVVVNSKLGSGWYIPAAGELQILYNNRNAIGGFGTGYYWSSTEYNINSAWYLDFGSGSWINGSNKLNHFQVRCVRSF
jgi:hypothetical protein